MMVNLSRIRSSPRTVALIVGYGVFAVLMALSIGLGLGVLSHQIADEDVHPIDEVAITIRNIPYCSSGDVSQEQYDIYLPKTDRDAPSSVVVFIHGGGWVSGDKRNGLVDYYGSDLVQHGIAVASINYRLAPRVVYPTQNADVAFVIQDIASRAASFGIDPSRIGLFGDSAGGLLAAMYALHQTKYTPQVKAVAEFYGTTDLVAQMTRYPTYDQNAVAYIGSRNIVKAKTASPLYQVIPKSIPPFLLFHGDKDTIVHIDQTAAFFTRLKAVNPKSKFVIVHGAGHYFGTSSIPNPIQIKGTLTSWFEEYLDGTKTV